MTKIVRAREVNLRLSITPGIHIICPCTTGSGLTLTNGLLPIPKTMMENSHLAVP